MNPLGAVSQQLENGARPRRRDDRTATITRRALVHEIAEVLHGRGVAEAANEARDLVAALADAPRFWPSLDPNAPVPESLASAARSAAARRATGAPFAYAVGRASFRYLTLIVDERVLIPRQETELLVEIAIGLVRQRSDLHVLDVGTGSGAIALAFATEAPCSRVVATDVSAASLDVARANVDALRDRLRSDVELRLGSCYAPVAGEAFDLIVSNPPYIAFREVGVLPASVRDWEPPHALVCGEEGLRMTNELIAGAGAHLRPAGVLALEVDERRAHAVADAIAREPSLRDPCVHRDLAGRDRFVTATRA